MDALVSSRRARSRMFRPCCEQLEPRLLLAAVQAWQQVGPGGGGALFSPSINPNNLKQIYIASDMGQIFTTKNGGDSWQTAGFTRLQGSHNSKVQFTSTSGRWYVLDYTDPNDSGATRLMRTDNGGASWYAVNDPTGEGGVITLAADYQQANRLIAADYSTLYFSSNGGQSFAAKFNTSNDAGIHIGGVLFDGSNIYVGTNQGVLRSTNGGSSFAVMSLSGIPSDQQIVSFAGAKEGGVTRFWAVTLGSGDVYGGVQGWDYGNYQSVYTLTLGQANWHQTTTGIPSGALPFYVAAAINDVDTVYLGGGSDSSDPVVLKSTTGGQSWTSVLHTDNNANIRTGWSGDGGNRSWSYGETALGFAVSPLNSSQIIITDYGFAHRSTDGGASWRALYVNPADLNYAGSPSNPTRHYRSSGLENTTSWQVFWDDATHLVGAYSDIHGARSSTSGSSWTLNAPGLDLNSTYRVAKSSSGTLYAAIASVHDMYQSTYLTDDRIDGGQGRVVFSTNHGQSWQTLHDFGHVVTWVAIDPTNPNRLYASVAHSGQGGIYVTNNLQAGASSVWTKLADPPRTQGHAFNIKVLGDGTLVASYSARRAGSPLAFTASSGVFVSTNGGQSWQDRSHNGMRYWTKDVVVDPHDPNQNTWYAAVFSGWGGPANGLGGLYRTTNRGVNWTRINALDRVHSITVSPTNPNEAYLTTEINGLWYTSNLRAASPTFTQVSSYPFRQPTRVFYNPFKPNEVWVTSFGGGIRKGNVPSGAAAAASLVVGESQRTPAESIPNDQANHAQPVPAPVTADQLLLALYEEGEHDLFSGRRRERR